MKKKRTLEEKKKNVIIQSANLFYRNGYVNTGLNEILEVCKIPKGSFYYYFKNKDDLLLHVIEYHTEKINNLFESTVTDLSIYKLKSFFAKFLKNIAILETKVKIKKKKVEDSLLFSNIDNEIIHKFYGGSPLGNINSELSNLSDEINEKLKQSYLDIENKIYLFLEVLSCSNIKYKSINTDYYTNLLMNMLEGTCLKLKREKNDMVIEEFLKFFDIIIEKMLEDK